MPEVSNGDVRLYYELTGGQDRPVLVFSNSLGSNLRMWDKIVPRLESGYRMVRYDTRGHGSSSIPPGPYTIDQLGHDLLFLLDHLGLERVNICGLSLGGMVSMWVGIHAPHRIQRLVLANTAARIGTQEMWEQRIVAVQTSGMAPVAVANLERWFTPAYRNAHPDEMETIRKMIGSTDPDGYVACCRVLRDTDLRTDINTIAAPCLVITGKHDPATPPLDGRALHASLRQSSYMELDSSHLSAWERGGQFADAVLEFLDAEEPSYG